MAKPLPFASLQSSFPPCANRPVDGIFATGGGPDGIFQSFLENLPVSEKYNHPRYHVAAMADGGNLIGR
jgi:hypothetical protein